MCSRRCRLWYLALDSELVFIGDAGNTEAGRPSRRYGGEWSNRWRALPWMLVDLDVAWNHARFTQDAPEGNYVPGAPDWVVAAGVSVPRYGPWSGAAFLRYIGSYPLTEDNSVRADAQTVVDAQVAYELARGLLLRLDVFNLFNAKTNDISYYYTSRLPGEPAAGRRRPPRPPRRAAQLPRHAELPLLSLNLCRCGSCRCAWLRRAPRRPVPAPAPAARRRAARSRRRRR